MSTEDLFAMQPLPPVGMADLGIAPMPAPPPPAQPVPGPQPYQPSKGQQIVKLAALASMLAGGPATAGLGAGVLQGQRRAEDEHQQQQIETRRLQQQQFEMERAQQQDYLRQQQLWQQQAQQKQQVAMSAAQNFRQRVAQGEFKDYAAYETAAKETSALLQNYYGMRIGTQYFMQAAQFRTKDDEQIIFEQLQKAFANPLSGKNIGPDDVITFKGSDGTPRRIPVAQAVAASSYPVVLDPSGKFKPVGERQMSPSEAAGAAGDFEERKRLKIASGIAYDTPAQQASVNQQIRKEMAADELKRKREERAALGVGDGPKDVTPTAKLEFSLKLRDRYVKETQAAQGVTMQMQQMRSALDAVKSGSAAAGSQGVLVTFQKILDPTSVVRESEYARSGAGLSILNRLDGLMQKWQKGGAGVPVGELETFVRLAETFARNQIRAAEVTKSQIDSMADEYGLDKSQITRDLMQEAGLAAPVDQPGPSATPVVSYQEYLASRKRKP